MNHHQFRVQTALAKDAAVSVKRCTWGADGSILGIIEIYISFIKAPDYFLIIFSGFPLS